MPVKKTREIPKTAKEATKRGYNRVAVKHSTREKQRWALIKHKGKWAFAPATSATVTGPHTVCYYDPDTGFYDDCHEEG
jgi:hypothetical protein